MAKIYMVCSVRKATKAETKKILAYAEALRKSGNEVRCPVTDTDQKDEIGLRIVENHEADILWADEIHVLWNPESEGSLWDVAQTRMAQYFMPDKQIYVINAADIEITDVKSYTNVVLATHVGLDLKDDLEELKRRHAELRKK